ncbi:MAG: hypothetical protein F4Y04_03835 [Chloroflexi bacterium]|nr:hypothetical protein [Chloroflexota bacterium]
MKSIFARSRGQCTAAIDCDDPVRVFDVLIPAFPPADRAGAGMVPAAVRKFLALDTANKMTYVRDVAGRHFDCDDFAVLLRADLSPPGLHSCGIIWGDGHVFSFFVLATEAGPGFVFVEPQPNGGVSELESRFSIERRCAAYRWSNTVRSGTDAPVKYFTLPDSRRTPENAGNGARDQPGQGADRTHCVPADLP